MMLASGSPLQALTPNPDKNSTCVVAALVLSVGFARHRLDTARDLGASLGEDFRRQRVVDARADDGSGRPQHGAQLASSADCAALCNGMHKEQPHDAAVQAANRDVRVPRMFSMDAALLADVFEHNLLIS